MLRCAVADVVLGLATGPFRVVEADWPAATDARIALAERWVSSARRVQAVRGDETGLTPVSQPSHLGAAE
jgi:hypothetical protein